jgi:hypothetical protein
MSIRSTYALDEQSVRNIKRLSRVWGVSQAEVVRRAVRLAAAQETGATLTPEEVVAHYASHPPPRDRDATKRLIESIRSLRHEEDIRRMGGTER